MALSRTIGTVAFIALARPAIGQLFLVDDTHKPRVRVSWPNRDGTTTTLEQDREYRGVNDRTILGGNLECFVAVGGIRLARGVTRPGSSTIRVGFVKGDVGRPFFENLADDAAITFVVSNVAFTIAGRPLPETVVQEIGYGLDPNLCGVPGQPDAQYNTSSPTDDLRGKITPENGRLGGLDGSDPGDGSISFETGKDGTITMTARIPYALFRQLRDPWIGSKPGTFNEPNHFHIEYEAVPGAAEPAPASAGR
ncbi:MAG: hypothetical protein IT437_11660 [Phycisphaerales bacterium]|nr:hypothetical protein [Phycisphaerales bacterium]